MRSNNIDITQVKAMPHDLETEKAVLSTLMRYNDTLSEYSDLLDTGLFYQEKEKAMFRCIDGVVRDGGLTDVNSLFNYAQSHDVGFTLYHNDFVEIISNLNKNTIGQDIMRLRDMNRRRQCWKMMQEQSQKILDMTNDFDDEVNSMMGMISEVQNENGTTGISSHNDALYDVLQTIEDNQSGKTNFLRTGFRLFDSHYVFRPDTMTVIAAFTSVGKSALAYNIVQNVARDGIPCAYYSLEMSKKELASRSISKTANMTSGVILNKRLSEDQLKNVREVIAKDRKMPIFYDDRATVNFEKTIRSIRTMVKTKGVRLAVIDYLQIYAQQTDDMEQSISYMARSAKNIAKELGIAVILISQLNRSALHPSIKMLRGSGQIEESADNVILIDRPEAYPDNKVTRYEGEYKNDTIKGTAKLILSKGRGIGTGCDLVRFDAEHTTFSDAEKPESAEKSYEHDDDLPF